MFSRFFMFSTFAVEGYCHYGRSDPTGKMYISNLISLNIWNKLPTKLENNNFQGNGQLPFEKDRHCLQIKADLIGFSIQRMERNRYIFFGFLILF